MTNIKYMILYSGYNYAGTDLNITDTEYIRKRQSLP